MCPQGKFPPLFFFLSKYFLLLMGISSVEDKKNQNQTGPEFLCCFLGSHQSPSLLILMHVFNFGTLSTLNDSNEIPHGRIVNHGNKCLQVWVPRLFLLCSCTISTFWYSPIALRCGSGMHWSGYTISYKAIAKYIGMFSSDCCWSK